MDGWGDGGMGEKFGEWNRGGDDSKEITDNNSIQSREEKSV